MGNLLICAPCTLPGSSCDVSPESGPAYYDGAQIYSPDRVYASGRPGSQGRWVGGMKSAHQAFAAPRTGFGVLLSESASFWSLRNICGHVGPVTISTYPPSAASKS